jgi:hypothetical protein
MFSSFWLIPRWIYTICAICTSLHYLAHLALFCIRLINGIPGVSRLFLIGMEFVLYQPYEVESANNGYVFSRAGEARVYRL